MKHEPDSLAGMASDPAGIAPARRNRFDRMEWAGAFGDLGTLIPFVTAYVVVLRMDPLGILLAFGVSLVVCGWFYRTPFPVQPMKAIGAVAATHAAYLPLLHGGPVIAATLLSGAFWLIAGWSGLATRIARLLPKEIAQGIVLGLGISFMLDGARMMSVAWPLAAVGLLIAVTLRKSRLLPGMFALLALGFAYSMVTDPALLARLRQIPIELRLPQWQLSALSWNDFLVGALYLALPQIPLTLGNAVIATTGESNRLFPDRPVSVRTVSLSTGLMNLFSAGIGGVPMCHGAGGLAAQTSFGARTGGAPIILGALLIALALCFGSSVQLLLRALPAAVLGVMLFMAGTLLARGSLSWPTSRWQALVILATAAAATWNVAAAFALGLLLYWLAPRRIR
jgi:MFS superfamily sulfate permease-like transporter